tara:strand:+ start:272 stop:562 length:291 start_codon:yes stop_codon:yes gene_type:complete
MTTLVFVDLKPNSNDKDALLKFLETIIKDTRNYDGCLFCDIYLEDDDVGMIFVENWESKAHYEKYLAWRIDTGIMEKLGAYLAAPPIIRFAEKSSV